MTDKRLVVTGIIALVFTVPVLVQALRDGNLKRRGPHGLIYRRRQLIAYWSSMAIGTAFALSMVVLIVYGLFKG
jgi:hypothetical protein